MKRVLIVDDAIDLGRLFQDALKTAHPGMPISVVPSAEEALLESTRLSIDLLVTDIRLPGMSGIELVRKIRVRQPQVKVLMITGVSLDNRTQKQIDEAKVDAFRRKPLGIGDFLAISDELLDFTQAPSPEVEPAPPGVVEDQDAGLLQVLNALPGQPVTPQEKAELRKKTGPLHLSGEPEETTEAGLSVRLSGLRASLGAQAALLLDDRGHIVAEAGAVPESELIENLIAPLAAAVSASARISYLLGQPVAETVQAYRGQIMNLVAAPVGQYTLLLALRPGVSTLRMALAFEEVLQAQAEVRQILEGMGLRVQTSGEVGAVESLAGGKPLEDSTSDSEEMASLEALISQEPDLEQLEALFEQKTSGEIDLSEVDSFWETAANVEVNDGNIPGTLNYDQAQKLGLLPDEEK